MPSSDLCPAVKPHIFTQHAFWGRALWLNTQKVLRKGSNRPLSTQKFEVFPSFPSQAAATCRLADWAEILPSGVLLWLTSPHRLCGRLHPQEARLFPQLWHHLSLCSARHLHLSTLLWLHHICIGRNWGGQEKPSGDGTPH